MQILQSMKNMSSGKEKLKLLVLGAGGHTRTILSILQSLDQWEVAGVLDREESTEKEMLSGVPVLGSWNNILKFKSHELNNAVVAIGDNSERRQLFELLTVSGFIIPTLVHPWALVDESAKLGRGCVVCMGAMIGPKVELGSNVIINTGVIVDHETIVGDDVHIGPGSRISGRVKIGQNSFLGVGVTVIDKKTIGRNVVLGAGSVLVDDLPDDVFAYGVPAKISRKVKK
jgi:sugar O-acyltransferase (sialic acid O-acetyltransferase NeuD family)